MADKTHRVGHNRGNTSHSLGLVWLVLAQHGQAKRKSKGGRGWEGDSELFYAESKRVERTHVCIRANGYIGGIIQQVGE